MTLVIGASGFLGSYLLRELLRRSEGDIIAASRSGTAFVKDDKVHPLAFDVTDRVQIKSLARRVSVVEDLTVYYLAAMHHPDAVEKDPALAHQINVEALARFLSGIENIARLYYTSSDTVYGEGSAAYRFGESDPLNPINEYGRSKARAEQVALEKGYNIFRFPLLIGPSLTPGKNHFYDIVAQALTAGKQFMMFTDYVRSALDYATAARLMVSVDLCGKDVPKVLNISGDKALSKYDIGLMIAQKTGADSSLVIPGSSAQQGAFEARRANTILMDNSRVKSLLESAEIQLQF